MRITARMLGITQEEYNKRHTAAQQINPKTGLYETAKCGYMMGNALANSGNCPHCLEFRQKYKLQPDLHAYPLPEDDKIVVEFTQAGKEFPTDSITAVQHKNGHVYKSYPTSVQLQMAFCGGLVWGAFGHIDERDRESEFIKAIFNRIREVYPRKIIRASLVYTQDRVGEALAKLGFKCLVEYDNPNTGNRMRDWVYSSNTFRAASGVPKEQRINVAA
jgi:hypothetical protein